MASDQQWKELAEESRAALRHLGYDIGPRCLPDEAEPCGGTYAQHAVAQLASLTAVITHHLAHLEAAYGVGTVHEWGQPAFENVCREVGSDCAGRTSHD